MVAQCGTGKGLGHQGPVLLLPPLPNSSMAWEAQPWDPHQHWVPQGALRGAEDRQEVAGRQEEKEGALPGGGNQSLCFPRCRTCFAWGVMLSAR